MVNRHDVLLELKERGVIKNLQQGNEIWRAVFEITLDHMTDEGGFAPYPGIKFDTTYRPPRVYNNPRTGEKGMSKPHYAPVVKFSRTIKDSVREKTAASIIEE